MNVVTKLMNYLDNRLNIESNRLNNYSPSITTNIGLQLIRRGVSSLVSTKKNINFPYSYTVKHFSSFSSCVKNIFLLCKPGLILCKPWVHV